MALTVKIKSRFKIPKLDLTKQLEHIAERILIPNMAKGIQERKDVAEKTYEPLDPKTIKRKGHDRPLIETGKLHRSFKFRKRGKNRVLVFIDGERREVAGYLQVEGVRRRRGGRRKFNFFGISQKTELKAVKFMEQEIGRAIKGA